ncbi:hypothetical protein JCM16814_07650 [Desulfobaculum senezii]
MRPWRGVHQQSAPRGAAQGVQGAVTLVLPQPFRRHIDDDEGCAGRERGVEAGGEIAGAKTEEDDGAFAGGIQLPQGGGNVPRGGGGIQRRRGMRRTRRAKAEGQNFLRVAFK